jgi:(2Fe-2S) ferredoxin
MRDYAKQRVKDLKLKKVRVNNAGCLNRCNLGPMLVIYPEGIWYRYDSTQDIDEIIESHLIQGKVVERLQR